MDCARQWTGWTGLVVIGDVWGVCRRESRVLEIQGQLFHPLLVRLPAIRGGFVPQHQPSHQGYQTAFPRQKQLHGRCRTPPKRPSSTSRLSMDSREGEIFVCYGDSRTRCNGAPPYPRASFAKVNASNYLCSGEYQAHHIEAPVDDRIEYTAQAKIACIDSMLFMSITSSM